MKQLSTVLNNILPTAKKTECVPAEQKYSLTKEDGKMITAVVEQSRAMSPADFTDNLLTLWKQLANLPKCPKRSYRWDYTGEVGVEPPCISLDEIELTENAKCVLSEILKVACVPISKQEFAMLYAKLKVLCKWHSVPADEKMVMAAYYDELKKFPAILVREALKPKYEWFPSFAELEKEMRQQGEHLLLLEELTKG